MKNKNQLSANLPVLPAAPAVSQVRPIAKPSIVPLVIAFIIWGAAICIFIPFVAKNLRSLKAIDQPVKQTMIIK